MDKSTLHDLLTERLDRLAARGAKVAVHLRGEDGRLEADAADRAAIIEQDEVLEGLDAAGRAEIGAIRAAIARLDAPDWDRCTRCGAPIGAGRLQAVPWAATCVGCAA
jgi:DnaK suppressor protein